MSDTPLWDLDQIMHEMYPLLSEVNDPNISEHGTYMLHPTLAVKLIERIRDDYAQRIADLEAEVARLRAETWVPVEQMVMTDDLADPAGAYVIVKRTVRLVYSVAGCEVAVDLPDGLRLCKRGAS